MNNEEQINALKEALRDVMMIIAERGQPLNEDLKALLVQVMEHVANRIQQLKGEEQLPTKAPNLEPSQHPSSNINSFGYNEDTGELMVKFQGDYPQQNGPIYKYGGVPKQIFELFRKGAVPARTNGQNKWGKWWKGKVPSVGASMFTLIKNGGYPYQKVA